ncbi:MAG TPA: LUD domain-containing protein [Anaeromyxobacteraceae bacterium]|nr:LUD domain-containing protein [Anaeromyxobacteraceae bacterium]
MASPDLKDRVQAALQDGTMGGALGRFNDAYLTSRAKAYEGIDFEALRDELVGLKSRAAARLDELAEQFEEQATRAGAKVFRTSDTAEVKAYLARLCTEHGVRRIAKSKSMITEEMHLNAFLQEQGVEVAETDLGEWIVQLAGQRPSPMVMPAIHLSKEQVAGIFSREVKEELQADIPSLVAVARRELREKFLAADMGITGANVAVAETGTLVVVTNEGNARLVSTLPRVQVAVVGVEKLVERLADVGPILKALPRSATGQLLTSYVSMFTGPAPGSDGQPKELHVILVDNRRTHMGRDPRFAQALRCIRCASCVNVCPVYRLLGGHVFGGVYTGGIGAILAAWFDALKASKDIQSLCIQCGACVPVCPTRIDIPDLIVELRRRLAEEEGHSVLARAALRVVNERRVFHGLLRAASKAQKPFSRGGMIRHLPFFLSGMTEHRSLPAIADEPFRDRFREIPQPAAARDTAAFYAGCLIDFAYPGVGESVVKVLNAAGVRVTFPEGQTCCGAPARYSGAFDVAARNARDNVKALEDPGVRWIVSACPTCTVALRHEFASVLRSEGHADWVDRAEAVAAKVRDFSSLVKELADEGRLRLEDAGELPAVTYHDSCHLKRKLHAHEPPRELLGAAGYPIREMKDSDVCCGMGGSYTLKFPEISAPILARKLENVRATGVDTVAMDCPGCMMQIGGGLDRAGSTARTRHVAELLADRLPAPSRS